MTATPSLFLSACVFFAVLAFIGFRLAAGIKDVIAIFVLTFSMFYGLRPLLFTLGLDSPFPGQFFDASKSPALAAVTLLWLSAYLALFAWGAYVMIKLINPPGSLFFAKGEPSPRRMMFASAALTAFGTLISAALVARYGGVGALIYSVKIQKTLTGLYVLKIPSAIGAIVATATFLQLRRTPDGRRSTAAYVWLLCGLLNGFYVFLWGQRSTFVIVGVMLLLGTVPERLRNSPSKVFARVLLAVLIVILMSAGLRVARDSLTRGEVQPVVSSAGTFRQISLATNSIYFDASMLAFRDWPKEYPYRMGEDFALGLEGAVPRLVWSGKPPTVVSGRWFRALYQPNIVNGWPIGAPTLWYLNFGAVGILFGGLLSGLTLGWITCAQRRSYGSGLNLGIALVSTIYVFQLGWSAEMPLYFGIWLAPLWCVVAYVTGGSRREIPTGHAPSGSAHSSRLVPGLIGD